MRPRNHRILRRSWHRDSTHQVRSRGCNARSADAKGECHISGFSTPVLLTRTPLTRMISVIRGLSPVLLGPYSLRNLAWTREQIGAIFLLFSGQVSAQPAVEFLCWATFNRLQSCCSWEQLCSLVSFAMSTSKSARDIWWLGPWRGFWWVAILSVLQRVIPSIQSRGSLSTNGYCRSRSWRFTVRRACMPG